MASAKSDLEWRKSWLRIEGEEPELSHPQRRDGVRERTFRVWDARRRAKLDELQQRAIDEWTRSRPQEATSAEVAARYRRYSDWWYGDTRLTSSLQAQVLHPAYLRIIGMGKAAIPFLLRDLRDRPAQWFVALSSITEADPVRPGDSFSVAATRWIRWGQSQGYEID